MCKLIFRCVQRYKFSKLVSALFVKSNYDKHKRKNYSEHKNITPFIIGSVLVGSTINGNYIFCKKIHHHYIV